MNKKRHILIRWRWAVVAGAMMQVLSAIQHYRVHDVTGWPVPAVLVLPLLTFGALGNCALAVMVWVTYFYGRSAAKRSP